VRSPARPGPNPGGEAQGRGPRAGGTSPGRGAVHPQSDADASRPAGPDREGHALQGACLRGRVSEESPTGEAGVSAQNRADRAEKQRGVIVCREIDTGTLHRRDRRGARFHAGRARPAVPETQTRSDTVTGTFPFGVPGCSPGAAFPGPPARGSGEGAVRLGRPVRPSPASGAGHGPVYVPPPAAWLTRPGGPGQWSALPVRRPVAPTAGLGPVRRPDQHEQPVARVGVS
jgi:hypothetical protein